MTAMHATDLGRGTWIIAVKVQQEPKLKRKIYVKAKNSGMAKKKAYKQLDRRI